jgi:hypothetical protein
MSEVGGSVQVKQPAAEAGGSSAKRPRGRLALELVAMRGKDVVGVRHLQEGGTAWVGNVADPLARVPLRDLGGQPLVVGEVRSGTYAVQVPPKARARVHGGDGIPRLLVGPQRVELLEGERAVVVLGPVQIRAQVVPFEVPASRFKIHGVAVWVAVMAAVYAAAVAISAALVQPAAMRADPGAMERVLRAYMLSPSP